MNEKLLTAGIGIAFGIAIAIGIFFWFSRPKTPPPSPTSQTLPTPTPLTSPTSLIIIDSPSDGEIITETPLAISGLTSPGAIVVVTGPADEQIIKADDKGQFLVKLKLEDGENTITASIVDERGTLQLAKKQIILEISQQ